MEHTTGTTPRAQPLWFWIAVIAAVFGLIVVGFNIYEDATEPDQINTDQLVDDLCAGTPDC